jgi:hypothetical protein
MMAEYTIEEIAARYKKENGRMYAGAYEWMIEHILARQHVNAESAASNVLRNKANSKKSMTEAGRALSQPVKRRK